MIRVLGMDLSLNHGALCELTDGDVSWFNYYTDLAGAAKKLKRAYRFKPPDLDVQFKFVWKLAAIDAFVRTALRQRFPDYGSLEDYAYRADQGAHQLGAVGGVARLACWRDDTRLRLYNPMQAKMYATHDGHASKEEMREAVRSRWDVDFDKYDQPLGKPTKKNPKPKPNTTVSEDLYDACALAKLAWAESQIRAGTMTMAELEHNKERRLFLSTSKTYPVNVLDREWICKANG